jgi:hypothetical protein
VTSAAGTFSFDIVPVGDYTLEAIDGAGNVRARGSARLNDQADEATVNLTLIGVGTVAGRVTNPDGTPAFGIPITLQSAVEGFRTLQCDHKHERRLSSERRPRGQLYRHRASASRRSGTVRKLARVVVADGEQVTTNIQLSLNLVPVTRTFYDANNFAYNLRENGTLRDGTIDVFAGDGASNRGAGVLDIISGGATLRFTGQAFGTFRTRRTADRHPTARLGGLERDAQSLCATSGLLRPLP